MAILPYNSIPAWTEQVAATPDTEIEADQPILQANSLCLWRTYNIDHAFENFDSAAQGLHRFFRFAPQGGVITNSSSAPLVYGSPSTNNEVWANAGTGNAPYYTLGTKNVGEASANLVVVPENTTLGVGGCNVTTMLTPFTGLPLCSFSARIQTPPTATANTALFVPYGVTFNKILHAQASISTFITAISQTVSGKSLGYSQPTSSSAAIAYLDGVVFFVYLTGSVAPNVSSFTPAITVWGI